MRPLGSSSRLQSYSLPEIVRAWERATLDAGETMDLQGHKLKPGPALNALVIAVTEKLSRKELVELLEYGVPRLEQLMNQDDEGGCGRKGPTPTATPIPQAKGKVTHAQKKPR